MTVSESYAELINRVYSPSRQEGNRPYPVSCYEIFLLDQAQQKAKKKEADLFRQLCDIFNWDIPRRQRNAYLKSLSKGFTLVLTDLTQTILWTSQNFLSMTGYVPKEVLGQKPDMLQGPKTDIHTVNWVRHQLNKASSVSADLVNYRKNGEIYTCRLAIDPLYNREGELTHYLAVESEL